VALAARLVYGCMQLVFGWRLCCVMAASPGMQACNCEHELQMTCVLCVEYVVSETFQAALESFLRRVQLACSLDQQAGTLCWQQWQRQHVR
jgi:hypothetical protein